MSAAKKQKIEKVPSSALVYSGQTTLGVVESKSHEKFPPIHGESFRAGEVIRFEVPAKGYLDPDEFCIQFRTKIFPGAANTPNIAVDVPNIFTPIVRSVGPRAEKHRLKMCQFVPGIQCLFRRIRLLSGPTVLEDIQDYNVLYRMLLDCTTSREWRETEGFMSEGVYDPENYEQKVTNANWHSYNQNVDKAAPTGHVYLVKPLLGLLAAGKHLPVKYMHPLTLELYLADNGECLWSSTSIDEDTVDENTPRKFFNHLNFNKNFNVAPTTNYISENIRIPTKELDNNQGLNACALADSTVLKTDFPNAYYEVDNCLLHTSTVYPEPAYDLSMKHLVEGGHVRLHYSTWTSHVKRLLSCTKTTVGFQERVHSLKGVLACMRNSPTLSAIDSDFCFPANGVAGYQWRIGSELLPNQVVECAEGPGPALTELNKALGLRGASKRQMINYITEANFLPHDLPHQLDSANFSELRRGTSQPSSFFMGIDMEKSRNQTSGFDSASTTNDIELILDLRPHDSIVTQTDLSTSTYKFKGAVAGTAEFQPSKKRVVITQQHPGNDGTGGSPFEMYPRWGDRFVFVIRDFTTPDDDDPTFGRSMSVEGAPEGFMTDMGVTYSVTEVDAVNYECDYSVSRKGSQYALLYFFAHIDQVIKLGSLGTSTVVR
jgi:hypothetical protein